MTIYCGNLPYSVTEQKLRDVISKYGSWNISNVSIPTDRSTGQAKGFAFIECGSEVEENEAIEKLQNAAPSIDLRTLRIVKAESKNATGGTGGGSSGGGGRRFGGSSGGRPSNSGFGGSSGPRSSSGGNGGGFRGGSNSYEGKRDGGFRNKSNNDY